MHFVFYRIHCTPKESKVPMGQEILIISIHLCVDLLSQYSFKDCEGPISPLVVALHKGELPPKRPLPLMEFGQSSV